MADPSWSLENRFDPIKGRDAKFDKCLYDRQCLSSFNRKCVYLKVGDRILRSTDDQHAIHFTMNIATLEQKFELELRLSPPPPSGQTNKAAVEANAKNRMSAHFSAHIDPNTTRTATVFSGPGHYPNLDTITFSAQLQSVRCMKLPDYEAAYGKLPAPPPPAQPVSLPVRPAPGSAQGRAQAAQSSTTARGRAGTTTHGNTTTRGQASTTTRGNTTIRGQASTTTRGYTTTPGPTSSHPAQNEHLVVTWKASSSQAYAFGRDVSQLPRPAQQAAAEFKSIMDQAVKNQDRICIVMVNLKGLLDQAWPRLCSLPVPTPPSYWPWLRSGSTGGELLKMINQNGPAKIENDTEWIAKALASTSGSTVSGTPGSSAGQRATSGGVSGSSSGQRATSGGVSGSSSLPPTTSSSISGSPTLADLPLKIKYHDSREYVAHVIGAFSYEEAQNRRNVATTLDGFHICDVAPDGSPIGIASNRYIVALSARAPAPKQFDNDREAQKEAQESMVQIGERVRIELTMDKNLGKEEWHGKVVDIPEEYRKFGYNIAIIAIRPQQPGGMVLAKRRLEAEFHFGLSGGSSRGLRERILDLMFSAAPRSVTLRNVLLARDNAGLTLRYIIPNKPASWLDEIDRRFLDPKNLNSEQREVVHHFLQHQITLMAGPPGTGKSTVIDAILEIEEVYFGRTFWVVGDSNAAADVLATKYTTRCGKNQVDGVFRVRPAFEERHIEDEYRGGASGLVSLPGYKALPSTATSEQRKKSLQVAGGTTKNLSLSAAVSTRAGLADRGTPARPLYDQERGHLKDFNAAHRAATSPRLEDNLSPEQRVQAEEALRREADRAFRKLQQSYVKRSKGIFSTASAASNPIMRSVRPMTLIMDESSQMLEARATHVIAHAAAGDNCTRILLVGDHLQLPPTVTAEKNPFQQTAKMSQFERLIAADTKVFTLKEQFRCHPDISSIWNKLVYDSRLRDAPSTSTRTAQTANFTSFVKQHLLPSNHPLHKAKEISSVVVSPEKSKDYPAFLSDKRPGSTSRLNFLTAAIVFNMVSRLLSMGMPKTALMISAFYTDQVNLIKALFASDPRLRDIMVGTIDSAQGKEASIHIIDCVVLGGKAGGVGDTLGFLSSERRRFNVAMSRAKIGRIVVGHKNMAEQGHARGNVWSFFMKEQSDRNQIIDAGHLQSAWIERGLREKYDQVCQKYAYEAQQSAIGATALHPDVAKQEERNSKVETKVALTDANRLLAQMVEATDASDHAAKRYIRLAKGSLHEAINLYHRDHPLAGEVEEID
ncbi:AAA domain-containing protein 4 [Elsinoe fawcettii]|nr:AAA domain-containing protein 4 [Elsinoe fawcettii]